MKLVEQFTKAITRTVNDYWPALVASELAKLGGNVPAPRSYVQDDKAREARLAQILKLRKQGLSQSQIGEKLGLKQPTISQLLKKASASKDPKTVASKTASKKPASKTPLADALKKHGSRTLAAKALGLARQTFSDRLAKEA